MFQLILSPLIHLCFLQLFLMLNAKINKINFVFAWMFLLTGVFAVVSSLFTWGNGWLFQQKDLNSILIPFADLIISGPLSLLSAYGLFVKKLWGFYLGLITCGVYILGSALVYIQLIWVGSTYPFQLVIPPLFGIGISISFFIWTLKTKALK